MGEVSTSKKSKKADVLNATLKLTAEKGLAATSTANIAEEAQVGMGTIYRYFKSKDELYTQLFNALQGKFMQLLISNFDFSNDLYANFKNIVFYVVKYYIENPYEFKFLERYSDSSLKIDQRFSEKTMGLDPLKNILSNNKSDVEFKPLPFFVLFAMVYGPLVAIVNLVHMGKIELTDELIYEIADSCWNSVLLK